MSDRLFPVEAGHVMMFARAIGDANPIYYGGVDFVRDRADVVAPPTFVEASLHYDTEYPYRPRIGHRWFGSGRGPSGADPPTPPTGFGEGSGTSFHAETHIEYFDVLRPGDLLQVSEHSGPIWTKNGARGGRLRFAARVAEFAKRDPNGIDRLAIRRTSVAVTTERKIDPMMDVPDRPDGPSELPKVDVTQYPVAKVRSSGLTVGATRTVLLVEDLSRSQILLYAGASGDFSPQHTDEIWNTRVAGYPTTFAPGMMTMGMTGRLLTDWFGCEALRRYSLRFARQVWPGDSLIAKAVIQAIEVGPETATLQLVIETINDRDQVVTSGRATVEVEP